MATTFLTIRQSQKRGMMPAATPDNPMASSQKYMTYIMPFFALTGLYWPFGLVLYWVTTNLWTLGQQWLLGRRYPYTPPAMDGAPAPAPASARSLTGGGAKAGAGKAARARGKQCRRQQHGARRRQREAARRASEPTQPSWRQRLRLTERAQGARSIGGGVLKRLGKGRSEPEPAAGAARG